MDIFDVEQKERLGHQDVAARLHTLADTLARHNDIELDVESDEGELESAVGVGRDRARRVRLLAQATQA